MDWRLGTQDSWTGTNTQEDSWTEREAIEESGSEGRIMDRIPFDGNENWQRVI